MTDSKSPINVVFTIDNNYSLQFTVAAYSLITNTKSQVKIYIVHNGIGVKERLLILASLNFKNCSLSFIKVDDRVVSGFHIDKHVSLATYYRVLLPEILPEKLDKILFLDADIVVIKDVYELYQQTLEGHSGAMVESFFSDPDYIRSLGMSSTKYFNAGVILMNLDFWRKEEVFKKFLELQKSEINFKFWDQDGLNILLENTWINAHPKWNAMHSFFLEEFQEDVKRDKELNRARFDPAIIHFSGGGTSKPWLPGCEHVFKDAYHQYLSKTNWYRIKRTLSLN